MLDDDLNIQAVRVACGGYLGHPLCVYNNETISPNDLRCRAQTHLYSSSFARILQNRARKLLDFRIVEDSKSVPSGHSGQVRLDFNCPAPYNDLYQQYRTLIVE